MNIGGEQDSLLRVRSVFIPFESKQVTINRFDPLFNIVIYFYDVDSVCLIDSYIMNENTHYITYPQTLNVPPPTKFIRVDVGRVDGTALLPSDINGDEFKIEVGNKATLWTQKPSDITAALSSVDYLKTALEDSTDIAGGLVSTDVILLKNGATPSVITGGLSGLAADNVGFWTGGTYNEALAGTAPIILYKDGSGQFGGGNIKLNADGTIEYTGKISSSSSGKRIIIDPAVNSIKMIDSSNREVMVANFGDVPNFSTAYIYLNGYSGTETTPSRYATISPSSAQLYHSGSAMFSLSIASNGGVNMITDLSKMPTVAGSIGQWYRSGEYIKIKTS